jgi:hypothetical protein
MHLERQFRANKLQLRQLRTTNQMLAVSVPVCGQKHLCYTVTTSKHVSAELSTENTVKLVYDHIENGANGKARNTGRFVAVTFVAGHNLRI